MGARIRIPPRISLWVLPVCPAVSLVAIGAVAVGLAEDSATRGYLIRQAETDFWLAREAMVSHRFVTAPDSDPVPGQLPPAARDTELLTPAAPGAAAGPALPADGSWLATHLARPVTVPATGTSGRWRGVLEAVRDQPQTGSSSGLIFGIPSSSHRPDSVLTGRERVTLGQWPGRGGLAAGDAADGEHSGRA